MANVQILYLKYLLPVFRNSSPFITIFSESDNSVNIYDTNSSESKGLQCVYPDFIVAEENARKMKLHIFLTEF